MAYFQINLNHWVVGLVFSSAEFLDQIAVAGEQVWQLPPGATCRQGNAGYNMYGQGMNQMWGNQMQQMPYGYQQTWYG